jgi:hypothetical protein
MVYCITSSFLKLKSFAKPILSDEVYLSTKEALFTGEMTHELIHIGKEVVFAEIEKRTLKL